jgi:error-prone DNA polymerase
MLPRLKPKQFYDLVIEVAIVRPGPIQGKMVHPYLRRRQGKEPVEFPSEAIREVLSKTLGVPIFQEQAMRLAVVAAGFTPGEADQLRRAMGVWRKSGVMGKFQAKLINGMLERGYPREFAERVYQQICGFGEYGFPESHAASFALLVYVSAWLKCHHPAAFAAALLNSQPMGFYGPAQLVGDARKHGVEVRPIDVNFSEWDCTLEPVVSQTEVTRSAASLALRLGFRLIGGLNRKYADGIVAARCNGRFGTFTEFIHRTGLRAAALKRLSQADAFGSLQMDRQSTLWRALPERGPRTPFDASDRDEAAVLLPQLTPLEEVLADYKSAGLTLRQHPMSFFRRELDALRIATAERLLVLDKDKRVTVAGVVILRQRPSTAKGITFVTLEDETGTVNLIVRMEVWEKYRRVARTAVTMIAHGLLQKEGEVIHVLVSRLEDMSAKLADLAVRSRDFH